MLVVGVRTPGSLFEYARFMSYFTRRIHSVVAAAALIDAVLFAFSGLPGAFLDTANQFVFLALHELQAVVCNLREFLFQFALCDIPTSFDCKQAHTIFAFGCVASPARLHAARFPLASGVPTRCGIHYLVNSKRLPPAETFAG